MPQLVVNNPEVEVSQPRPILPSRQSSAADRVIGAVVEAVVMVLLATVSLWVGIRARFGREP